MIVEQKAVDEAMVEQLVTQVRGVLAVRVVVDAQKQVEEVHVVGSPGRSAKQMVRDVESILYVRGGIRLDHRKISLVQIAESVIQPSPVRVQLLEIVQAVDGDIPTITVSLAMGDQRVQGVGRGRPDQPADLDYLVGYATIHALDQLIGPRGQFKLENLERQQFGQLPVYLSHLTLAVDDGIETLLGISVVRGDVVGSVARAILDAVNRRLQRMLGEARGAHR